MPPHNQGKEKTFEKVVGCLIAFACRLSFKKGNDAYRGWLAFDILEESKIIEIKLMSNYAQKYHALKYGETTMVIPPKGERKLNAELVLKLSVFSHTRPEDWYRIQVGNELMELRKEEKKIKEYQKFDYRNLIEI